MAPRRGLCLFVVLAGMSAGGSGGWPQVAPYGPEFQVNVCTTGYQMSPLLSVAPDGSFTVTWYNSSSQCPTGRAVLGRRLDDQGLPIAGEEPLSQYGANWPSDLGTDAAGNFVLVWGEGATGPGGGWPDYVKGRRFDSGAAPREDQFAISAPPGGEYTGPGKVAVHEAGNFVVVWYDYEILARRYDADGLPLGSTLQVAGSSSSVADQKVAVEPDGGFLVVWKEALGPVWGDWMTWGRRYDSEANPVGTDVAIAGPMRFRWGADVSVAADSSFVVAFSSEESYGQERIEARRFASSGEPLGPSFLVDTVTEPHRVASVSIEASPDGSFVVVWSSTGSHGSDTSGWSIQARRFDSEWTPLGNQFQVNSLTTGGQELPSVAAQPNGELVVAWFGDVSGGDDSDGSSIQARRFRVPFFLDGFESGDTSRWSAVPSIP